MRVDFNLEQNTRDLKEEKRKEEIMKWLYIKNYNNKQCKG